MSLRSIFVAEPGARATAGVPRPVPPGRTAILLASPADAGPLGALLALAMARSVRSGAAVLLAWRAPVRAPSGPAAPGAARLSRSFTTHELAAAASGRLVRVVLPDDEDDAVRAVTRAVAASPVAVPVTIALGGPRGPVLDELLAAADVVAVAGGDDADPRAEMALAGAAGVARRVVLWPCAPGPARRRLALAGISIGGRGGPPHEALA